MLGPLLLPLCAIAAIGGGPAGVVEVGPGTYAPHRAAATSDDEVEVGRFRLDVTPVTNRQFLAFVAAHPAWRRDRIAPLFAERTYLDHWAGPLDLGAAVATAPVTRVSWFAARAYCRARGARLPRLAEWELAAAASERARDGRRDAAWREQILAWYARPATAEPAPVGASPANAWGVRDLHGLIWEWVEDFGTELVADDARASGDDSAARVCGAGALDAADPEDYASFMRTAYRSSLEAPYTARTLGFRCATGPGGPSLPEAVAAGAGDSLYGLDLALSDQRGATTRLDLWRGRPTVIAMFYASCPSACPMTIRTVRDLIGERDVRVLMVSFDPGRDDREALAELARAHHLDDRWRLATTDADSVRLLASALGVRYRQVGGEFAHSTPITVVDGDGVVVARAPDLAEAKGSLGAVLERLAP